MRLLNLSHARPWRAKEMAQAVPALLQALVPAVAMAQVVRP